MAHPAKIWSKRVLQFLRYDQFPVVFFWFVCYLSDGRWPQTQEVKLQELASSKDHSVSSSKNHSADTKLVKIYKSSYFFIFISRFLLPTGFSNGSHLGQSSSIKSKRTPCNNHSKFFLIVDLSFSATIIQKNF